MMPRTFRTIPSLLMITLLAFCGAAVAGPLDISASGSGHGDVSTDAVHATGGLDGALDGNLAANAKGSVDAQLPDVQSKVDDAKATVNGDVQTTTGMGSDIVSGFKTNLGAFGDWIHGLFGSAKADASGSASGALDGHGVSGGVSGAGHLGADVAQPPQPDVGFVGKIKAGITSMLHL